MDKLFPNAFGRNLQNLRIAKGISLSKLASDAGIAKSNLSRLEQGSGNPTLDTIWRLAIQLDVPFSHLITSIDVPLGNDGVQVKLIEQGTDVPQVDAYWMSCAPNTERIAEPHSSNTYETIMVISGALETGTEGHTRLLKAGECFSFCADQSHVYRTKERWTTFLLTITYLKKESHDEF